MLSHVEQGKGWKDRKVMLSLGLLDLLRDYWREARSEGWLFPGYTQIQPGLSASTEPGFSSAKDMAGNKDDFWARRKIRSCSHWCSKYDGDMR